MSFDIRGEVRSFKRKYFFFFAALMSQWFICNINIMLLTFRSLIFFSFLAIWIPAKHFLFLFLTSKHVIWGEVEVTELSALLMSKWRKNKKKKCQLSCFVSKEICVMQQNNMHKVRTTATAAAEIYSFR